MELTDCLKEVLDESRNGKFSLLKVKLEKAGFSMIYSIDTGHHYEHITVPEGTFTPNSVAFMGYDRDFNRSSFENYAHRLDIPTNVSIYSLSLIKKVQLNGFVQLPVERNPKNPRLVGFGSDLLLRQSGYGNSLDSDPLILYVEKAHIGNRYFAQEARIFQAVNAVKSILGLQLKGLIRLHEKDVRRYNAFLGKFGPLVRKYTSKSVHS